MQRKYKTEVFNFQSGAAAGGGVTQLVAYTVTFQPQFAIIIERIRLVCVKTAVASGLNTVVPLSYIQFTPTGSNLFTFLDQFSGPNTLASRSYMAFTSGSPETKTQVYVEGGTTVQMIITGFDNFVLNDTISGLLTINFRKSSMDNQSL